MLRVSMLILVVGGLFLLIILGAGYSADEQFKDSIKETFGEKRLIVWQSLIDLDSITLKKRDVESVEILANRRGYFTWRENLEKEGKFRIYAMIEKSEPSRLVVELKESSNGLTGKWTYLLEDLGDGTQVTIIEESSLSNIFTRGLQTLQGRDVNLIRAMKTIRVGLFQQLLHSP